MYYETFSRNVNEVIEYATALAKRYGCRYIGSEHILFGLYRPYLTQLILLYLKL